MKLLVFLISTGKMNGPRSNERGGQACVTAIMPRFIDARIGFAAFPVALGALFSL
jgi:hypothetical protein